MQVYLVCWNMVDILLKQHSADFVFPPWTRWDPTDGVSQRGNITGWRFLGFLSCFLGLWVDTTARCGNYTVQLESVQVCTVLFMYGST